MHIKVAVLDLYDDTPNLGLNGIIRHVEGFPEFEHTVFDVRAKNEIPGLDYDIYIFSGGPGDPRILDEEWCDGFFGLLDDLWKFNHQNPDEAKQVFNICHSFQMVCFHFGIAKVVKRRSESFGVYPAHKTAAGKREPLFSELNNPFWVADFRQYQCVQPDKEVIARMGAKVVAIEKFRPHVPLERALMAVRLSPDWFAVQFHPEAHAAGMLEHFYKRSIKRKAIDLRGKDKYARMIEDLGDPDKLMKTNDTVLPGFLTTAREKILSRTSAFVT